MGQAFADLCDCESKAGQHSAVEQASFDEKAKGSDVKVERNGTRISGEGCCIANAALHQDQCYFEVNIVALPSEGATFSIGVAHRTPDVVKQPLGDLEHSWCFSSATSTEAFEEGDTIGCAFDQSTGRPVLKLSRNNEPLPPGSDVQGFRGVVYPAVGVTHGAVLECNFSIDAEGFKFLPPSGFSGLIPSRSLV